MIRESNTGSVTSFAVAGVMPVNFGTTRRANAWFFPLSAMASLRAATNCLSTAGFFEIVSLDE